MITMYRTGAIVGKNGLTTFIMKGDQRKAAYTDALLVDCGCNPGSTISMKDNAYMTDETWVGITKSIVDGYRQIYF